ncbi:MAG: hypothetical protein E7318_06400 [Clostridiales bacterium]|nr:hypothetical protein [Clostridiales bacterium]
MTTKELKAIQPARTNKVAGTVLLSCLAILAGCCVMLVLHERDDALWTLFVGMHLLHAAIAELVIWVVIAAKQRKRVFAAFAENEIFVERDGGKPLRKIEELAVEHFGGNLKQALVFAVTSPEISRMERSAMSIELMDYEREYVQNICGMGLKESVAEARREVLTRARIEADLADKSRTYRKTRCAYQLMRAECMAKCYFPSIEGESETIELKFGDAGLYSCTQDEYEMTTEGDQFCLVKLEGKKNILLAYAEKDWIMDESLFS